MRLTVQNFRRCRDVQIEGKKPVQLLIGGNQEGKSSILGSVVVALTGGQPAWLTRRGESVYDLRREGAKKAEIELHFAPRRNASAFVLRTISAKAQSLEVEFADDVDGCSSHTGITTDNQRALCEYFGLSQKQLSCLLDAGQFLAMDSKEQTAFLAGVSGAELTQVDLTKRLRDDLGDAVKFVPFPAFRPDLAGVDLLDACLKWSTEERKTDKRILAEKQTLLGVADRDAASRPEGEEPEDVQARVNELDARYDASLRLAGQIEQADAAVVGAQEAVAAAEAALVEARQHQAPTEALAAAQEKLAPLVAALEALREEQERTRKAAAETETPSHDARIAWDAARRSLGTTVCPTCKREWSEGKQQLADEAEAASRSADEAHLVDREAFASAQEAVAAAEAAARPVRDEVASMERQVQTVAADHAAAQRHAGMAVVRLEQTQQARAALADPEPLEGVQAELATLQAWADWKTSQEALAALRTTICEHEKTVETWEWLVAKFGAGPGSYRAELLEGKLGALEAAVNEALIDLLDEGIVFPSGDTPLSVKGAGYTRPATRQYLSGSQELRLQIALQYGLCKALEFPLLLVDCEAALDAGTTRDILLFCKDVAASWSGVQMLVAMAPTRTTWREDFPAEAFGEWADVWAVVDGKTERMTEEAQTDE
jgi:DNA repair exonuclease SbcCD ATPase subunit